MQRNEVAADLVLDALIAGFFRSGTAAVVDGSLGQQVGDCVDQDNTDPVAPEELVRRLGGPGRQLLDFGCGTGGHRSMLEGFGYAWRGVNYREGMAEGVREEAAQDTGIDFYDGLHLPYTDTAFDVVYSFQTFEHIQDIGITFREIARVLRPGGALVGAVSYLEQFHDYSTYNFTPYGLKLAAERAGLRLAKLYPSYDVFTWMLRRLLVVTSGSDVCSLTDTLRRDNRIHDQFVAYGQRHGLDARTINLMRLMFSAHVTFQIDKP